MSTIVIVDSTIRRMHVEIRIKICMKMYVYQSEDRWVFGTDVNSGKELRDRIMVTLKPADSERKRRTQELAARFNIERWK